MKTVAYYTLFIKPGSSAGRWLAHHPPTHSFTVLPAPFWILFLFQHGLKNITSAFRNQQSAFVKVKTCQANIKKSAVSLFLHTVTTDFHPTWRIYYKPFLEGSLFPHTSYSISSSSWKLSFPKAKFAAVSSSYSTCLQLQPWDHGSILTFWPFFLIISVLLFRGT